MPLITRKCLEPKAGTSVAINTSSPVERRWVGTSFSCSSTMRSPRMLSAFESVIRPECFHELVLKTAIPPAEGPSAGPSAPFDLSVTGAKASSNKACERSLASWK